MAHAPFSGTPMAHAMLQSLIHSLCDRPGDTQQQRAARILEITASVFAFQPRDAVEMMLAGLIVMHVQLIQHTAREAVAGKDQILMARTKSALAALDRAMLGFSRELRVARKRKLEDGLDTAPGETPPARTARVEASEPPAAKPPVRRPDNPPIPVPSPVPARDPDASGTVASAQGHPARQGLSDPRTLEPLRRCETSVAALLSLDPPPALPGARAAAMARSTAADHHTA